MPCAECVLLSGRFVLAFRLECAKCCASALSGRADKLFGGHAKCRAGAFSGHACSLASM